MLEPIPAQAERLIALGVHAVAGIPADRLRAACRDLGAGLLTLHPDVVPASVLVPLVRHAGKAGFVVADMTDVDEFAPRSDLDLPAGPLIVVDAPDRGDDLANRSPNEALPVLTGAGRSPLLLTEGLHWVIQSPAVLERNHCFMTIGSRRRAAAGRWDSRTPAIWISNGTGRDGPACRDAPKVGWCWAGNRHTWLGIASAASRTAL